ncbi:SAM-dependent DNA methyltransferase [Marinilabilia sp.]|uniref:SAM-dependent DNA methyltransferase n=1 Tax=Marinilabilia sp. TaxID=2021252 RepID=UPI0025B95195|nr:SAM-dependent DNA methyltransferase [Marinilabilia sp.]
MGTENRIATEADLRIGDVFTPIPWAWFAIERFNIFQQWMDGATIFDPTMGQANLLDALIRYGIDKGLQTQEMPIQKLFGNELNKKHYTLALKRFSQHFGMDMSQNFSNLDILELPPKPYDIIFGNPPWQNFNDLPASYKEKIKPYFEKYNLTGNKKNLLLGHSRIDLAALIVKAAIQNFLSPRGDAYLFMPLSLLLNDGAHESFRSYTTNTAAFAPIEVFDFNKEDVFKKISTRYGLIHFRKGQKAEFPINYKILNNNKWELFEAAPITSPSAPLSIFNQTQSKEINKFSKIALNKKNSPRQGLNTCGANDIFFFKECQQPDNKTCLLNKKVRLPSEFIYPLLTASNFREEKAPKAWVLLPYTSDGRPVSKKEIHQWPELHHYLNRMANRLRIRKGTLINSWISKGIWWAMLGVGPYNFAPYKIVWEAYGRKRFSPQIFDGNWQANQALQAFIPCYSKKEAKTILKKLQNPIIEKILLSYKMEGTMNWAQPGKIKKLIDFF